MQLCFFQHAMQTVYKHSQLTSLALNYSTHKFKKGSGSHFPLLEDDNQKWLFSWQPASVFASLKAF
jgi:hypothetical protein